MDQKIRTITTFLINEETSEEGMLFIREQRDEAGNQTSMEEFSQDGKIDNKTTRTFDAENRVLEEQHFSQDTAPHQTFKYTYNEDGKIHQKAIHYLDGSLSVVHYNRNVAENSLEIKTVDEEQTIESREYRRFDMEGRILEEAIFGEEDVFESRIKSSYDNSGRPIERHFEYADGRKFSHFFDYEFDKEGRLTFAEAYDVKEESVRVDELVYDEKGNQIEHRIQDHSRGYSIIDKYDYDEKNQLTKEARHYANGMMIEEKEYHRDENNLLVKQETTADTGGVVKVFKYEFWD